MPKHALADIPQELPDELFSQISSALATDPQADLTQVVGDFIKNAPQLMGAIALMGGAGGAMATHQQSKNTSAQTEADAAADGQAQGETQDRPSSSAAIPDNTISGDQNGTSPGQQSPSADSNDPPSQAAPSAAKPSRPPLDVETSKKLIANVQKIEEHRLLNPVEKADLDQAKGVVVASAQKIIDNISKLRPEARQHPKVQKDLAAARKTVEAHSKKPQKENDPGAKTEGEPPSSTSTRSSSGSLPTGHTATTSGQARPEGHTTGTGATNSPAATKNTGDSSSSISTSSSSGPPSPHGSTRTANGVTPPLGYGLIPESTTSPEHIGLARRRVENLSGAAAAGRLDPNQQKVYDNALRILDRNSPLPQGNRNNRNNGNPDDLAMSGDSDALVPVTPGGEDVTLDAEADAPPADIHAPAPAVGTTIDGPRATNPDVATASSVSPAPPPSTSPAGAPQTTSNSIPASSSPPIGSTTPPATIAGSTTTTASAGISTGPSSNSGGSPSTSPPGSSPTPSNSGNGNTPPPSYPPIDYDHIVGGDVNAQGTRVTGGHSLHRGDVRIIPGTELPPNAAGVYRAQVQIKHPTTGLWITKANNNGNPITNTMFPKNWSEQQIKAEIDAAWTSPNRVVNGDEWISVTPSGVRIRGYINTGPNAHRVTAFPLY